MKKTFLTALTAVIKPLVSAIVKGVKWLYGAFTSFFEHPLTNIVTWLKRIVTGSIALSSWLILFEEFGKKILGYLAIITGISSGALGAKQVFDFAKAVIDPQEQMLDWLSEAFANFPSINSIIVSIDDVLRSLTTGYFTPPLTMTYLLQVTGVGEAFNQYLQALISTLIFVFSVFIIRWAFANNFTFTKEVPGGKP